MGGARLRADDHRQPDVDRRSGGLYRPRLVIGADGVTLDLAGHTIAGDGHAANCPGDAPCYVGVDDSAGYPDVTFMGAARSASSSSASSRQRPHIVCGWSA